MSETIECKSNEKLVDGKCVANKVQIPSGVKKSNSFFKKYNPLKMWGSWIGVILAILLLANSARIYWKDCGDEYECKKFLNDLINFPENAGTMDKIIYFPLVILGLIGNATKNTLTAVLLTPIIFLISGFSIGYGVHSIIRKVKK